MEKEKRDKILYWLNQFESYISTWACIILCVLLAVQVVSRYAFGYSITWTEEVGTLLFVLIIYTGYASAVTNRKHIRITFLLDRMPFRIRRIMLIVSDLIFMTFCVYVIPQFMVVVANLRNSKFALTGIPKRYAYMIIPFGLVLISIRLIQDCLRLSKENEKQLGKGKVTIDVDALEQEYLDSQKEKVINEGGSN